MRRNLGSAIPPTAFAKRWVVVGHYTFSTTGLRSPLTLSCSKKLCIVLLTPLDPRASHCQAAVMGVLGWLQQLAWMDWTAKSNDACCVPSGVRQSDGCVGLDCAEPPRQIGTSEGVGYRSHGQLGTMTVVQLSSNYPPQIPITPATGGGRAHGYPTPYQLTAQELR